ncbi:MAG: hypothetical protein CENE_03792 [Candidatus Celerinatantimonas neptuna]|nr:MAG: hypothetical protein CENE_03792 [Candidatus Celerinatantimonas neptuna]
MKLTSTLPFFSHHGRHDITYHPVSLGDFEKLPYIEMEETTPAQEFEQYKALILAMTDLNEADFDELTAPDFLQLRQDLRKFTLTPSDELQHKPLDGQTFKFDLLFPFTNELGETISHIVFTVPKVKHSEALAKLSDDKARENFMFQVVTGLTKADVEQMAMNDFLAIKGQVGAFFTLAGDYFHPATLKPSSI